MEANKELIRRYHQAMERGALDEATAFWADDATNYAGGRPTMQPQRGRKAIGEVLRMLHEAFPDRRYQLDQMIAEGDLVACRLTVSGTFAGRPERPSFPVSPGFVGVEGTELIPDSAVGKRYTTKHVHVFRIQDGRIAEHWAARDDLGLLLQVGAITPP